MHPPLPALSNGKNDLDVPERIEAGNSLVSAANVFENGSCVGPFRFGQSTKIRYSDDSYAIANTDSPTISVSRRQRIHSTLLHRWLPKATALDFW